LEPLGFKILNFNSKNEKISKKFKNTSRCVESNGVKNFQIFIHLVYFAGIRSSTKKEKGEKLAGSTSNGRKKY
jgi:c-di-GMP-related signal transduction protein